MSSLMIPGWDQVIRIILPMRVDMEIKREAQGLLTAGRDLIIKEQGNLSSCVE
jgi:hypothetical protein